MEHVKRLILIPEHMTDTPKKALVPPLTAQVNQLDSELDSLLRRQDMIQDEKVKLYDQTLQRYLTYYDKRMQKPVHVLFLPNLSKLRKQENYLKSLNPLVKLKRISWRVYPQ